MEGSRDGETVLESSEVELNKSITEDFSFTKDNETEKQSEEATSSFSKRKN